jgi:hypothetical protein
MKVSSTKPLIKLIFPFTLMMLIVAAFLITPGQAATSATVTVNPSVTLVSNNLQLGFQMESKDISAFRSSSTLQNLAKNANFKLIKFFDHRVSLPCTSWSETTKTGTWNWAAIDNLVDKIYSVGAQPMISAGFYSWSYHYFTDLPRGMTANYQNTKLPNPSQYAAYISVWIQHFKARGTPVIYWELFNEPVHFFNDGGTCNNFKNFMNPVLSAMKAADPNIKVGCDNSMVTWNQGGSGGPFNVWFANNINQIDYLSWHRYLTGSKSTTDSSLFNYAINDQGGTYGANNFINPARQVYYNAKGTWLNCMQTEANIDYSYSTGTDPRIQQMSGAVATALALRTEILNGNVLYNIYMQLGSGSKDSSKFGMINLDNNQPWYPYYAQYMISGIGGLSVGDSVIQSSSSSSNVIPLVWKDGSSTSILLINKSTSSVNVALSGVSGPVSWWKIDNSLSTMQSGSSSVPSVTLNGYTVMLLRT